MDRDEQRLIPPPDRVREELARNYEEAARLRRLLKISVAAAESASRRSQLTVSRYRHRDREADQ
jgi:hypothetical protein